MVPKEYFNFSEDIIAKASGIKLVVSDVDGVLTRGDIIYDNHGNEFKVFNVKDGLGFKLLASEGIHLAIITGRDSEAAFKRFKELNITDIFQGVRDKDDVLRSLMSKYKVEAAEVMYLGDDWNDLKAFAVAGFSVCPADAHPGIMQHADYITKAKGGTGVFREITDLILLAKNKWNDSLDSFSDVN